MIKILADAGTSWTKILEIFDSQDDLINSPLESIDNNECKEIFFIETKTSDGDKVKARVSLFSSQAINQCDDLIFDAGTGHMSTRRIKSTGKYENELVALAMGGMKLLDVPTATLVDLGSRDSKWIKYDNYKYSDLNWNGTCGSGTGATIEMVCNFYNIYPENLPIEKEKITVTCGVFGMEKIMDQIAKGEPADKAISRYIHGIAFNVWNFAQKPDKIYLSGGMCLNKCFVESLKNYCDVQCLGRYVLLEGLF